MNTNLKPYVKILDLIQQWTDRHGPDCLDIDNMPETKALREYDAHELTLAMSTILTYAELDTRMQAIDVLPYIVPCDVMIDLLIPCLSDPSPDIRWTACESFHGNPDPRAVLPLVRVLEKDKDPDVRLVAAEALSSVGDERALPALDYAVEHDKGKDYEDRTIANAAQEAIAEIGKRLSTHLASDSY